MNENKLDTNNKLNSILINGPRHYSTSLIVSLFLMHYIIIIVLSLDIDNSIFKF